MLLLTDRPDEGVYFQRIFGRVQACDMVALKQATEVPAGHDVIVCHANLAGSDTRLLVDAALTHHRPAIETPVLFLVPEMSGGALLEAAAFGATEVMLEDATNEHFLFTLRRMHRRREAALAPAKKAVPVGSTSKASAQRGLQQSVEAAGTPMFRLLSAAGRREPLSMAVLDHCADALIASIRKDNVKNWLTMVQRYDDITYQHCLLVAGLVTAFSARLSLTPAIQNQLVRASIVHDIGKVAIPRAILNKTGALTSAEMDVMRTHPVIGHEMLSAQPGVPPALLDVVRHHHEFLDGSGYPDRLRGREISDFCRIVTICDIYGALIERRPYKALMSSREGRAILHGMVGKLDAGLLNTFDAIVRDC